ncbi:regulatory LuxR family protein [Sinobacterium caligoides]|uniref:Regulatory LuxR family protein n=1 Tax=Sinobacterium caligoides TaxID=933926 RepID=A0A3N2DP76_9GAMM|nr:helix-turn-helix transcriptional regulator [Sinobacterium caligoides]ROS01459.1 regulatory LuxR family protein [Sinobacterium caligoides]
MSTLANFSQHLSNVLPSIQSKHFAPALASLLRSLVEADDLTFILYLGHQAPKIDYFMQPDERESKLQLFQQGAFLVDPFYLAATKSEKKGFFTLKELAPEGFKNSEYYRNWYRLSGLQDECGYLIDIANGFINISLGHTANVAKLNKSQRQSLRDIEPAIVTLCQQHYGSPDSNVALPSANKADETLRLQLQTALDSFGRTVLTDRECQVINMLMHGHSTKSIAELLCISTETVKLHRKKSYAKLDINSQSELFYLFIDSLMSVKDYKSGDTLSNYL